MSCSLEQVWRVIYLLLECCPANSALHSCLMNRWHSGLDSPGRKLYSLHAAQVTARWPGGVEANKRRGVVRVALWTNWSQWGRSVRAYLTQIRDPSGIQDTSHRRLQRLRRQQCHLIVRISIITYSRCSGLLNVWLVPKSKHHGVSSQLVSRTYDLKSAYRRSGSAKRVAVYDPHSKTTKLFRLRVLPFGAVRSVHSFLRLARALWFVGTKGMHIAWTNFYDDFVVLTPPELASQHGSSDWVTL